MIVAVALTAGTLLGVGSTPAGAQMGSGTITGVVGPSGPGLPYRIWVVAVGVTGGPSAATEAESFFGTYSLSVPPGSYYVWFIPVGRFSQLGPAVQLYLSASSYDAATPVVVNEGATTQLQPQAAAPQGATVAGQVADGDGRTLADCDVQVITRTPIPTVVGGDRTDFVGAYRIENLPAGDMDVVVHCGSGFAATYHGDTTDPGESAPITTTAGTTIEGVDVTAARTAASVAGTATTTDGSPAGGACVFAYSPAGAILGASPLRFDGGWAIADLPVGDVRVGFHNCAPDGGYLPEWYDDVEDFAGATPVPVTADAATTQIDAVLTSDGSAVFVFTDPGGNPVNGVCVWLTDAATGTTLVTVQYAGVGNITVDRIPPGTYSALFTDCGSNGFAPEWYQDAPDHASSTPITVMENEDTVVNATLG